LTRTGADKVQNCFSQDSAPVRVTQHRRDCSLLRAADNLRKS